MVITKKRAACYESYRFEYANDVAFVAKQLYILYIYNIFGFINFLDNRGIRGNK